MQYLHLSAKVENRIESLENEGKAGRALAQRAQRLIDTLAAACGQRQLQGIKLTKYGEKRIAACRKYDLGCGYRLITLQRGEQVWISFLGTHDESHRWLEANSRTKSITPGKGSRIPISPQTEPRQHPDGEAPQDDPDDERPQLSDRQLRQVFAGLIAGGRSSAK